MIGYLSIPVGVVVSGYVKNYLLGRVCRKRGLVKTEKKTFAAIFIFALISAALGYALSMVSIASIFTLGIAMAAFGALYLPTAFVIDRFLIK